MSIKGTRRIAIVILGLGAAIAWPTGVAADEVLDWNAVLQRAIVAGATPGPLQGRVASIVHVSMFDALNGIERRYTPIHFDGVAPKGASRRAAVAQAAYTALLAAFPTQSFDADLEASLEAIANDAAAEKSESIERGRSFGRRVAEAIVEWRRTDGLNPPAPDFLGSNDVGTWRPTPRPGANPGDPELPGLPGAFPNLAITVPWVIPSPSFFRPTGPPALTSAEYAADFNEVKLVGERVSAARTADQTESARFWAGTALTFWNRAAATASRKRHLTLSENARLFALLNVAIADSVTAAWDAKYYFVFWRPITAIRLADTDGNDATEKQDGWVPLIVTPPYPDYTSGNQSNAGPAQAVLTAFFGDQMPVSGFSEGLPGVTRSFANFAAAADDALNARIWSGIHFRFAMDDARRTGEQIAAYVLEFAAKPVHGNRLGQLAR